MNGTNTNCKKKNKFNEMKKTNRRNSMKSMQNLSQRNVEIKTKITLNKNKFND